MKTKPLLVHITTVPQSLYYFLIGQGRYMREKNLEVIGISSPGELLQEFAKREEVASFAVSMSRTISPFADIQALFRLFLVLRKLSPHIVHAHTPKAGLLAMIASLPARVPVRIYHVHGVAYVTAGGWRRGLLMATEWISCTLAHQVIVVSSSVRNTLISDGLCPKSKAKVLGKGSINGVDATGRFNPERYQRNDIRSELGIPQDALVIGFIGRLVRDKGVCELIRVWLRLRENHRNLFLLLIGTFETRDALPETIAHTIKSDDRIVYLGQRRETASYYAAMDVFVLPTYREGLPMVLLEAQAMKLPVVATRVTGCVDAMKHGDTGVLIPPCDEEALERALTSYLCNRTARNTHGHQGREMVLREFRPEDLWTAQYEEYVRLMKERIPAMYV